MSALNKAKAELREAIAAPNTAVRAGMVETWLRKWLHEADIRVYTAQEVYDRNPAMMEEMLALHEESALMKIGHDCAKRAAERREGISEYGDRWLQFRLVVLTESP